MKGRPDTWNERFIMGIAIALLILCAVLAFVVRP